MTSDTERPDEGAVAAPHFEARLWQELSDCTRSSAWRARRAPRLPTGAGRGRCGWGSGWWRRPRRSRASSSSGIAGAMPGARTPGIAGGTVGTHRRRRGPAPSEPPPVSIETRIINATEEAVAASIVKVTQVDAAGISGDNIMWTDEQSGRSARCSSTSRARTASTAGPRSRPRSTPRRPTSPTGPT